MALSLLSLNGYVIPLKQEGSKPRTSNQESTMALLQQVQSSSRWGTHMHD